MACQRCGLPLTASADFCRRCGARQDGPASTRGGTSPTVSGPQAVGIGGQPHDLRLLLRVLGRARAYWPHIVGVFLVGLLASPLALLAPLPIKIVVDNVLGGHPLPEPLAALVPGGAVRTDLVLLVAVASIVAIALATQLQEMLAALLRAWTGERLVLDLRAQLFEHVQRLSFAWSDARGTADSIYRIQHDAPSIQYVAVDGVMPFVTSVITVGGMIYISAQIDWVLALVALGVCPCLLIAIGAMRQRVRRGSRELKQLESGALSVVQEVLAAIRVVKAFGQEERERRRYVDRSRRGLNTKVGLVAVEGGYGILIGLITAVGTAAVIYIGAIRVESGLITLGELLLVLGYLAQLYSPLTTMSRKAARMQTHLASAERAFALLDELPDVRERRGARALERATGAFVFDGVTFGYEVGRPVLRDVHLIVEAGARVGLTGTTGAGKTTLVSLLNRFYDPTDGRILLDGVDLRDYRLADLRNQFAIVLQDPVLLSTSIAENISYGRPGARHDEIVRAAQAAGAADFIERLPNGYETPVGERGMRLSGGERQRVALARAFLRDAPILILDEPTSAVDVSTEAAILAALEVLMRGRTTFMIAHRASTLALCDTLLALEPDPQLPVLDRGGAWTPARSGMAP